MARKSAKDRVSNEVNAGSMADIAFLLLIFFLVTTTMDQDKGVLVKLPIWSDVKPDPSRIANNRVLSVLVNANDDLLVRGEPVDINVLRMRTKEFIMNPNKRSDMPKLPKDAIISLKNDRGTHYAKYLAVYNELKAAYSELQNNEANKRYGKNMDKLSKTQKDIIKKVIPMILSEAESTSFGEEN
jgi:biopolymer transport protein ExbD